MQYFRYTFLILMISLSIPVLSQETETDTTVYASILTGPDAQNTLNYYLMVSATDGDTISAEWLLHHGAEINSATYEGITPLIFAVANNRLSTVDLLLKYGSDVNIVSNYSETPLLIAVKNQNLEIAELLIRDSADINFSDRYGATPLHYASIYGYFYIVDMLLYYNAEIYNKANDGTSPLMAAIWSGYLDIADLLLQNGADPEEKDNQGFTPLLIAAQNGDTLMMDLLLKRRVNLYEVDNAGYNALDIAIRSDQKAGAEYLLRKGDKWSSPAAKAVDPYSIAQVYRRKDLAVLLQDYNIPKNYKFGFDQVTFNVSANACFHDYFIGASLSFKEPSLNAGIFAGFDTKPGYTRILIKEREDLYYQYMDKGSMAYAGLFKDIALTNNPLKGNLLLTGSLAVSYRFGDKFKGTEIIPEMKIRIIPGIGIKWSKERYSITSNLSYMKTEFYKVGPVWLRMGFSYTLFFNDIRAQGKIIKWYGK
jgi:ankyrin repeat protein